MYMTRCFTDLTLAMRHSDDTPFYCYRAIEALRHHHAATHRLKDADRAEQWQAFRDFSGVGENEIRFIATAAKDLRHGGLASCGDADRAEILKSTWAIVDRYLSVCR
jgi:hypothetical protein